MIDAKKVSKPTSNNEGKEPSEIYKPRKFKRKYVDKITNFNTSTDTLEIDTDSFDIDRSATFAPGKNKSVVKKPNKTSTSSMTRRKASSTSTKMGQARGWAMVASLPSSKVPLI